jgi:hypothetical protein
VADDRLIDEAMGMGKKLAGWNREFLWQTKRTFHRAASMEPEHALEMARDVAVMMGRFPK